MIPTAPRARLAVAPTEEAAVFLADRGPFWRCRVFRWHHFVRLSNPDGGLYHRCALCGMDRGPVGHGPMTTPPWPVGSAGL